MGDAADMMLDGTLCEGCGVFMDGEACDYPRLCADCAKDRRSMGREVERNGDFWIDCGQKKPAKARSLAKVKCPTCGRKVKHNGLKDHQRDAHAIRALAADKPPSQPPG